MPQTFSHKSVPSLWAIERPRCPKCQTRMSPARISPGPSGFDLRKFECSKCEHVLKETVGTDPMKSSLSGWHDGDLGAPE
jgi:transposase-like protein